MCCLAKTIGFVVALFACAIKYVRHSYQLISTHKGILHSISSSCGRFLGISGVINLLLDLWQQHLQLLHLLPLLRQSLGILSLVQKLLQFFCKSINNFKRKSSQITRTIPKAQQSVLHRAAGRALTVPKRLFMTTMELLRCWMASLYCSVRQ